MTSTSQWSSNLAKSLKKNKKLPYAKYFQLATVREGRPSCRTVVFRGFHEESDNITFVTDIRSSKVAEIQSQSLAEACWYLPNTREQYRLYGALTLIDKDLAAADLQEARHKQWHDMSDPGRAQFAWPHPGQDRHLPPEHWEPDPPLQDSSPLDTFCLVIMIVESCDYLSLKHNQRFLHTSALAEDGKRQWECKEVNP